MVSPSAAVTHTRSLYPKALGITISPLSESLENIFWFIWMWPIKQIKVRGSEWFSSSCPFSPQSVLPPITTLSPAKPHWPFPCGKKLYLPPMGKTGGRREETGLRAFPSVSLRPPLPPPRHSPSPSTPLPVRYWPAGVLERRPPDCMDGCGAGIMMRSDSAHSSPSPSGRLMPF